MRYHCETQNPRTQNPRTSEPRTQEPRHLGTPEPSNSVSNRRLLERIRTVRLSDDALEAMDAVVRDRKRHPARTVELARVRRDR